MSENGVTMQSDGPLNRWPVDELLDAVAAHAPAPGGGMVAALAGAMSAALGRMVASYGTRNESESDRAERLGLADRLVRADMALRRLMDEDAQAYTRYDQIRRERRAGESNDADFQQVLMVCAMVPMEIAALAGGVLEVLDELRGRASKYIQSDLRAAAILAEATVRCAGCSVRVNLELLADRENARSLADRLEAVEARSSERLGKLVSTS